MLANGTAVLLDGAQLEACIPEQCQFQEEASERDEVERTYEVVGGEALRG
jgi:hypothetical protein